MLTELRRAIRSLAKSPGFSLVAMSLALQYGLSRLPATRAIVILLFELVVAAIAANLLAGESLRAQDWIGGALIVAATLATAFPVTSGSPSGTSRRPRGT